MGPIGHRTIQDRVESVLIQESFQQLADRTGQFVVEYRRECLDRPVVVAVPTASQGEQQDIWRELRELQMVSSFSSPPPSPPPPAELDPAASSVTA